MCTDITFTLSSAERRRLNAIAADPKSPQKHVWRARIVLLSGDGVGTTVIMAETGKSKTCVWRWQEQFMHEGVDGLLSHRSRPAGKAPVPPERVAEIIRLTKDPPPHEATHWTLRAMARVAGIAASTVQAIWKAHGLSPYRGRQFKLSNDPKFADKLTAIVGLHVDPPAHAVCLRSTRSRRYKPSTEPTRACPRSVFHSVVDLQAAFNRFVRQYNAVDPKPFVWKASPDDIIVARNQGLQTLESIY